MSTHTLASELKRFAQEHPQGWSHDEWLGLLFHLTQMGIDTHDEGPIGLALERERLILTLADIDIKGLGPKRREAIANHFGTIWNLLEASPEEISSIPGVSKPLADQVSEVLQ